MTTIGFNKPLYVQPFDHRESFAAQMFGWHGTLTTAQTAEVASIKRIIFDGFTEAVEGRVPRERAGILVDEHFGASILRDAAVEGYMTACSVERSGKQEFEFEYGEDFAAHIEAFHPTFCKVLVRYNPKADEAMNQRQASRLKRLSDYLHRKSQSRFMFELLVPPTAPQMDELKGNKRAYDFHIRPTLMAAAIHQLQDAGVEPDVWKIEGLDRHADCENIVTVARRNGRDDVGCIVLGRGETEEKVRDWLTTAAAVDGFIGFAVGRTVFWDPLDQFRAKAITREDAVLEIAYRYMKFIDVFETARAHMNAGFLQQERIG